MSSNLLADHEELIRAIPYAKFNRKKKVVSFQAFIDKEGVSVGRTEILKYEELLAIYVNDFDHPPAEPLIATVAITVGRVKLAIPPLPPTPPPNPEASAEVEEDAILEKKGNVSINPAHALIHGLSGGARRALTEGQAKRVLAAADVPRYYAEGYPDNPPDLSAFSS